MDEILVTWYNHTTTKVGESIVEAYGIIEAIEKVRANNNYNILVLKAEYCDVENLIKKL